MQKVLPLFILLLFVFPTISLASNVELGRAAFLRNSDLWLLVDGEIQQITTNEKVINEPKWSHDGKWVIYQIEASSKFQENGQQVEVWAYELETQRKKKVFYDGYSPTWSPKENIIAFISKGILNISDFKQFYNTASGVNSYSWLPDGSGFLLSSAGKLQPDGWTGAKIYKKELGDQYKDLDLFEGVKKFFTLPNEIGIDGRNIIAVYANDFSWSPSAQWISFIVSPTASMAMDSNVLCVLSSDGRDFEILDEIILHVGKPKWAPSKDTLAYIAGGGRIVLGFKDKKLKTRDMPVTGTFTPVDYADLDFDWLNDVSIVTSRVEEKEWSNDFRQHPLPALYTIHLEANKQIKITDPPEGYGDYHPQYVKSADRLVWIRKTSLIDTENSTLWMSNPDGTEAKEWLRNVEEITFYP